MKTEGTSFNDLLSIGDRPVATMTIIYVKDGDKVLLLKRGDDRVIHPGEWSGLGGKVEPGESLYDSAKREVFEESGLIVDTMDLRGTFSWITNKWSGIIYVFVATRFHGTMNIEQKEGMLEWMSLEKALGLDLLIHHQAHYLSQVLLEGSDFYAGFEINYLNKLYYADNKASMEERRKAS